MTAPVRQLPCTDAGSPAGSVTEQQYTNILAATVLSIWGRVACPLSAVAGVNDLTATCSPALTTAPVAPQSFWLVPAATNTGGVTLNIDGQGVVDVVDDAGDPLPAGTLEEGRLYLLVMWGDKLRLFSGSGGSASGASVAPGLMLEDQKAQNTAGGTATSGSWVTRTLNTSVRNEIAGAGLSSNEFTLPPGVFLIEFEAPAGVVNSHQARIYNVTDGSPQAGGLGGSEYGNASYGGFTRSTGMLVVSLSTTKTFRLEHRVQTTRATDGFGPPANLGTEIYSRVRVWKVGDTEESVLGLPGGPITIPYSFSTTTTDSDPGDGKLRLNNATQNAATVIRLDNLDSSLNSIGTTLAALGSSTLLDKAWIRIVKANDRTKWLLFKLRSIASPSGYKNFTVVAVDGSGSAPFANNDAVLFEFGQNGDVGLFGGGVAITYTIDTSSQADSDPGAGIIRLNQATQNTTTQLFPDLLDAAGADWTAVLDSLTESESTIKGYLRLTVRNDHSKWLLFKLTAWTTASGYRKLTVACVGYSAASPFTNGDVVVLQFSRTGDLGQPGGVTLRYTFSTTTTDADPGSGALRLDNATQDTATTIRADLLDAFGTDWSAYLATLAASTNTVKGQALLQKYNDPSKFILFNISALASPSGYKNITVVKVASSASSPFSNGDVVTLSFVRTGDKGDAVAAIGWNYSTTTTDADPGTGSFRANHATFSSITQLFVDNAERGGTSVTSFLDALDDSTNTIKGFLTFVNLTDPTQFAIFKVSGSVTDGTGYRKVPVNPVVSNGYPWTNGAAFAVMFNATGDKGADGSSGTDLQLMVAVVMAQAQIAKQGADGYQRNGAIFVDGFQSTDGINSGSSTNYTVDTVNKLLKPSETPGSDQATSGNAISGGDFDGTHTKSKAFNNVTTGGNDEWYSSQTAGAVSGAAYIGQDFGAGNEKQIRTVTIKQGYTDANARINSVKVQRSSDGSSWSDVSTHSLLTDTSTQTLSVPASAAYRYWRLLANANTSGGLAWVVDEIEMMEAGTTNNMTALTTAQTSVATVNSIMPVIEVEIVDAITINTDLTVEVSANGGVNYVAATLSQVESGKSGKKIYAPSAPVDVSANPGTSIMARIKTLNNKATKIHKVGLKWAA